MNPLFSIIIPTYNSEKHLELSLTSVLNQTFHDFEIIVLDALSTDKTVSIAQSFNDKRITVISEKDNGIYDAMNKGICLSSAKWILFLGSDDLISDKEVLLTVSKHLADQNIVYGNVKVKGNNSWAKDGEIYDGYFDLHKLFNKNICHQSIFYNSDFIRKEQLFFSMKYPLCADWDFNLRCRSLTDFLYVDLIITDFNSGGLSTKTNSDEAFSRDMLFNLITYFTLSPFDPLLDNPGFLRYHEVLGFQKKYNPLRYFIRRIIKGREMKTIVS